MADFTTLNATAGAGVAGDVQLAANYIKHVINQADVGRELIISVTNSGGLSEADLLAARNQLTLAGGDRTGADANGPDAFTIAAIGTADGTRFVADTTTVVYFRAQGTGTPNLTTIESGATDVTLAVVAVFQPAK